MTQNSLVVQEMIQSHIHRLFAVLNMLHSSGKLYRNPSSADDMMSKHEGLSDSDQTSRLRYHLKTYRLGIGEKAQGKNISAQRNHRMGGIKLESLFDLGKSDACQGHFSSELKVEG